MRHVTPVLYLLLVNVTVVQAELPQYQVNHSPYVQLGNAQLGGVNDQMEIWWQTISAGGGSNDSFSVDYRLSETETWTSVGINPALYTGVDGRINHSATITGLNYDTDYDYRVKHLRVGQEISSFQNTFRTRLPAGDTSPYTFVAYGDSAGLSTIGNFRSLQNRINQLDANRGVDFTLLLGDNAYNYGKHSEYDARFNPTLSPELTQYIARKVDYLAVGNHDIWDGMGGQPTRDNYSVPRNGPVGEWAEHNYSFDYGNVHFTTFDSNSLNSASRLENQLDWLVADMQDSTADWKIVFAHHPVAGAPDKYENPGQNYYKQVVKRLREADVDLLMVGHSHTYYWTYPLLGEADGQAIFVEDVDKDYTKGQGLVQITSGTSGRSLRSGSFAAHPFNAAGFTTSTRPRSEYGFAKVDVTDTQLTVSYVAADDGAIIDAFTITDSPSNQHVWSASTLEGDWSGAANWNSPGSPSADWEVLLDSTDSVGPLISVVDGDTTVDRIFLRGGLSPMTLRVPPGVALSAPGGIFIEEGAILAVEGELLADVSNVGGSLIIGPVPTESLSIVPEPCTGILGLLGCLFVVALTSIRGRQ